MLNIDTIEGIDIFWLNYRNIIDFVDVCNFIVVFLTIAVLGLGFLAYNLRRAINLKGAIGIMEGIKT